MDNHPFLGALLGIAFWGGMLFVLDWAVPAPRWECHPTTDIGPITQLFDGLLGCKPPIP